MNKKNNSQLIATIMVFLFAVPCCAMAQDSTKKNLVLTISYFMNNNKEVYLMASTKTKIAKKFQPVTGVTVNLYLDADSAGNLIGKVTTDKDGLAKAVLPPALKTIWDQSAKHTFMGVTAATKDYESSTAEASISKSKIVIDTTSDAETRTVLVKVEAFNGTAWTPVKDVEMKLGVSRTSGSILSAGDEATYTTDSTGTVTAEFKKLALPGDEKGNIVLVAKVEYNEQLGNLRIDKTVPWGVAEKIDNSFFNQRTLWSTRFRTPFWLLFMAYSIVIGVWGTLIYLVFQMIKIKKLGIAASQPKP